MGSVKKGGSSASFFGCPQVAPDPRGGVTTEFWRGVEEILEEYAPFNARTNYAWRGWMFGVLEEYAPFNARTNCAWRGWMFRGSQKIHGADPPAD